MAEAKVIVIPDGKICDYIDGKFRNDTPEEYVRQTIEKRLVNEHMFLLQFGVRSKRAHFYTLLSGVCASCGASFSVSRRKLPDRESCVTSFRQGGYTPLRR